jgi:hypothetical protein
MTLPLNPEAAKMQHPNLFILGAQRAGTTWLAAQMSRHPDIFFSDPKEPLLMGRKVPVTQDDYAAYLARFFAGAADQRYRADGSANTFQSPQALDRVRVFVPGQPKFIICLRQPVEKAVSFFLHNWRRDRYRPGVTFAETLTPAGQFSPLLSSLYSAPIKTWLAAYPRENFLFLKYDDLSLDPTRYLAKVSEFLDLEGFAAPKKDRVNVGLSLEWDGDVARPVDPGPRDHPAITLAELQGLQDRVIHDIQRTQALTGLDLSDWAVLRRDLIAGHDVRLSALRTTWS